MSKISSTDLGREWRLQAIPRDCGRPLMTCRNPAAVQRIQKGLSAIGLRRGSSVDTRTADREFKGLIPTADANSN